MFRYANCTVAALICTPCFIGALTVACATGSAARSLSDPPAPADAQHEHNTLTEQERADGWRLLFDGETTAGWRGFRREGMPDGWQVVDGTLARVAAAGDIITIDEFENFDLKLEWKISPGGNSGIFWRVSEDRNHVWETGPEMQVLDDEAHRDGLDPKTSAGADYALYAPAEDAVKPAGEWNTVRIRINGADVTYWMNGKKIVEYELWSEDWRKRVAASKFASMPQFGRNTKGHIALQDHGDAVWFRNIRIRELPPLSSDKTPQSDD